jgi:PAS domain S-box-containing protein
MYTLLQSLPYAAHVVDDKLNVIAWNRGAERRFGWAASEAIGQPCPELVRTVEPALWTQRIATLRRTGLLACRSRVLNRDGLLVVVDVLTVARQSQTGVEYMSVLREIDPGKVPTMQRKALAGPTNERLARCGERAYVLAVPSMSQTNTVGAKITARREQAGYSKRALARLAGVSEWQLRAWENNTHEPTARSLMRLIPYIGGTVEYYLADGEPQAASA